MLLTAEGGSRDKLTGPQIDELIKTALEKLGVKKNVLILPPDHTRSESYAGEITRAAFDYYRSTVKTIMPALGTHQPMSSREISDMFGDIPQSLFKEHDWRNNLKTLGRVPADYIREISGLDINFDWPAQVNRILTDAGHDLILSIGQVVPHEVIGMANHNKNIFIGAGGSEGIHKSHYLGALYGMERIMGKAETPVRQVLNYASANYAADMPVIYILTVVSPDESGNTAVRGLFIGDDFECFKKAAALSAAVNITKLSQRQKRVAVYLPPDHFKSTWLGNKAVYRSRMAIEDGGELTVIAPGVKQFGEDAHLDSLIRKYGYFGTEKTMKEAAKQADLQANLSAAAHLIHGSSEGRFTIRYAAAGLSRIETESAGYEWMDAEEALKLFSPLENSTGICRDSRGEEFYLIKNVAIGLWKA